MTDKEKTWRTNKDGFFVLVSNIEDEPDKMLDRYFGRMDIEVAFKTIKEHLELLPLCKWTDTTVKILCDVIARICYSELRSCALKANMSVTEMLGVGCRASEQIRDSWSWTSLTVRRRPHTQPAD